MLTYRAALRCYQKAKFQVAKTKRKICVVTGGRAEYGLLFWLMKEIQADPELELQVVATGMHLSPEFGLTVNQITADGFPPPSRVDMLLSGDSAAAMAKGTGLGVIGFSDTYTNLKPDIVVVLGDRFEILAAAQAAMLLHIPIAHLHGGELTLGAVDENIRHAITKMSHLHFVAAEPYRRRVIQMGESPARVFNFGAPGLDAATRMPVLSREDVERQLNFALGDHYFVVTYHPETLSHTTPSAATQILLDALDEFPKARLVFTKANADVGGRAINTILDEYCLRQPDRAIARKSLGHTLYLNAVRHSQAVIGNSSSGLIEAPYFEKPTVNIGDRQRGRLRANSVIDCKESKDAIVSAIKESLSQEFTKTLPGINNPYGQGDCARRIKEVLGTTSLSALSIKEFHDL